MRGHDFATDVAWTAAAGATGICLAGDAVEAHGVEATKALLAEHGLAVSSIERAVGSVLADDPIEVQEQQVARAVELCVALGAPAVLITTGPIDGSGTSAVEADRQCRAWFERMAPIAVAGGVRLMLEPVHPLLRWVSYVHTLRHAVDLTGAAPGTGVLVDVGHLWWDRDVLDDIATLADQIVSVQIDDVDPVTLREFRYTRLQLGDGAIPLPTLVGALEAAGYTGWYENENGMRMKREDRIEFFREGGRRLAELLGG